MKVRIVYFKPSGKYYSQGEYTSKETMFHRVVDELYGMFTQGDCPGLNRDGLVRNHFDAYATIGDPNGVPHLIRAYQICRCDACERIERAVEDRVQ
jgi:hypothetical protein